MWKQILHPNVSRCDWLNTRYLCTCSLLVNLSIFVFDSIGFFSFSFAILVQCLLMNKDTFILGPSNQSLRLASKGGFSQIWWAGLHWFRKRRPGMHKVDHNYKAHLLGLQYPRDILSTCTFHHQQYFIIFSFLVQEMQKHNIRKLWCRKIMVLH